MMEELGRARLVIVWWKSIWSDGGGVVVLSGRLLLWCGIGRDSKWGGSFFFSFFLFF